MINNIFLKLFFLVWQVKQYPSLKPNTHLVFCPKLKMSSSLNEAILSLPNFQDSQFSNGEEFCRAERLSFFFFLLEENWGEIQNRDIHRKGKKPEQLRKHSIGLVYLKTWSVSKKLVKGGYSFIYSSFSIFFVRFVLKKQFSCFWVIKTKTSNEEESRSVSVID